MIEAALKAVDDGMGITEASRVYKVDRRTLRRVLDGERVVDEDLKRGPECILSEEVEASLAAFFAVRVAHGFGCTKVEICDAALEIAAVLGLTKFRASRHWLEGFLARSREHLGRMELVHERFVSPKRAEAEDEPTIRSYFESYKAFLRENFGGDLKPECVFNMDETPCSSTPERVSSAAVLAFGSCHAEKIVGDCREFFTLMACGSAAGLAMRPTVILKGSSLVESWWPDDIPAFPYILTVNPSGFIKSDIFRAWMREFIRFLDENKVPKPRLLLLDNASAHSDPAALKIAADNDVKVFFLPPYSSHFIQPLDVGVFSAFKTGLRELKHK